MVHVTYFEKLQCIISDFLVMHVPPRGSYRKLIAVRCLFIVFFCSCGQLALLSVLQMGQSVH